MNKALFADSATFSRAPSAKQPQNVDGLGDPGKLIQILVQECKFGSCYRFLKNLHDKRFHKGSKKTNHAESRTSAPWRDCWKSSDFQILYTARNWNLLVVPITFYSQNKILYLNDDS